jgi:hypothetical protein
MGVMMAMQLKNHQIEVYQPKQNFCMTLRTTIRWAVPQRNNSMRKCRVGILWIAVEKGMSNVHINGSIRFPKPSSRLLLGAIELGVRIRLT